MTFYVGLKIIQFYPFFLRVVFLLLCLRQIRTQSQRDPLGKQDRIIPSKTTKAIVKFSRILWSVSFPLVP